LKDKNAVSTNDDDLLIAVYTKVYKNATGTFSLDIDVLDGQTQTSDLPQIANVAVTIDNTLSEPGPGPNVIFLFRLYQFNLFNFFIISGILQLF